MTVEHDLAHSAQGTRITPPPLYRVILLNDDFTPMDYVVQILRQFFGHNGERATVIMLQVHNEGRGVCGVYPKDIATTKVAQVTEHARAHQHPLQCVMEVNE